MRDIRKRLMSTAAVVPLALGIAAGGATLIAGSLLAPETQAASCNPCAAKKPCNPCNPCAVKAAACNPCNPCAAKNPCNPCAAANPCNPCAAGNPCNPCAAGGSAASTNCFVPRIQQAAAANPCAAKNPCNPCAAKSACNPCAAQKAAASPCNPCAAKTPCNPCAAKNPCNPCAAKNPCNPCAAKNPCAAQKAAANPCAAKNPCNPCAAKNPCNPCAAGNPCNPCAAAAPVELKEGEAAALYGCMQDEMQAAYAKSDIQWAKQYASWTAVNTAPYQSATHGERQVNNLVNETAAATYVKYDAVEEMPEGSVLAKDSFTVTKTGAGSTGPLFLMEKMAAGWNEDTADWKYTMVMPDGKVFGETKGKNAAGVAFCHECHAAAEANDHMFFLPSEYRKQ